MLCPVSTPALILTPCAAAFLRKSVRHFLPSDLAGQRMIRCQPRIPATTSCFQLCRSRAQVVDGIVSRADVDDNEVIDFQEFCEATPKTLRVNLIKLAKKNGDDLGFLV